MPVDPLSLGAQARTPAIHGDHLTRHPVGLIGNQERGKRRHILRFAKSLKGVHLRVLAAGSPVASDDGVNTAFLSARLTLTGPAVSGLVATVAPGLAAILTRKLAAQAVPILGAITGAALNAAYLGYYRELARIRFALLRLGALHGAERVVADFSRAAEPARVTRA